MIRLFEYQDADLFCHHSLDESPSPSEFYMHAHERMEILYFLSGDAQYLVEGSVYPLHPGELLIMNRAEAHKLQLLSAQPYERIVMHFSPSVLRGFDPDGLLLRVFAEKPLGRQNHYASPKFSALFSEFDAPGSPEHLRIHMLLILANVLYKLCSLSEAAASAAAPEVTASPEEAAAAPAAETAVTYPLTVTDQLGREVTIETEPKTLASGYYISTSLLIALGLQDELVGVEAKADKRTIYSLSAPELQSLPSIGTAKEFDLEGCAALTPDLVIVPAKLKDSIPQMEELGLTVLAVKPEDQDKLYGAIDLLAQATNTVARGEELKSAIEDNLLSLREAIGDAEAPTVYMAGNSSVLQTAGPAMYQNYMIENAGGLNAAASVEDTYWAEVSYEQVLDWDPDYIILASDADYDVDSVLNDAALADCTAVREGHVYQLPHAIEAVDSPVPGSFLGSVYLGSVLHPEQVSEQFYHDCADAFYTTYYGFTPASYE